MDVSEAIQTKRAVRKFLDKPISAETLREIVNAGRRAQSSKNMQPWHFIVVTDKERLKALSETGTYAGHIAGAAAAIAIITPPIDTRFSVMFDAGQSASYMQLAAWDLGIGSCLATIYEPEKARQLLGFPEDMQIHVAISFGYPQDENELNRPNRMGGRRTFDEVVHWGKW